MLTTTLYSIAHFAVDLGCAFAVFSSMKTGAEGYLLYNFFAFAMQMPLGVLADRWGHGKVFAAIGCLLVAMVGCLPSFGIPGAIILGLGNGLFHVGGGVDVMALSGKKAGLLGVFVSPGAFGLFIGTMLASTVFPAWPVIGLNTVLALLILRLCRSTKGEDVPLPGKSVLPLAAALFLVVVLRSFAGLAGSFSWKTGIWSWIAVGAVVLGKTAGGFASDRFGARPAAFFSLGAAAVCFCLSGFAGPGAAALFLFNMSMPITLWGLAQAMPGHKGFSFGLLTFALFLGFLPAYLGVQPISGYVLAAIALLSALLLAALPRRKAVACG
jgi:FSR family fosmidomycin resistance protein-like MFS transporter